MTAARAVVVLVTGDDEARPRKSFRKAVPRDAKLVPQPRPNVLIEIGMALCISQSRTVLARLEPVRDISDIVGLNFVSVNNTQESREILRRRLKLAGCEVGQSLDYLDSRQAGDFDAAVLHIEASPTQPESVQEPNTSTS
jgi:predicted nucleotide-binding protein